jgi:hypothetical protein
MLNLREFVSIETSLRCLLCVNKHLNVVYFLSRFWKGLLAVWLGGGIGQSFAFLLARCVSVEVAGPKQFSWYSHGDAV